MLTVEGRAYVEGALFLLQHAYSETPVEEYELVEFLSDNAPELEQPTRQVIVKGLLREAQDPERLRQDLIESGWLKETN